MMKKVSLGLILFFLPFFRLAADECYSEYWQNFLWKMWEKDSFAIRTFVQIDSANHFKNIRALQINEQFAWEASENLSLELHYTYIHGRSVIPNSLWRWQQRLELEANRIWHLPDNCLIKTRNRLEIRRVQSEPKTLYRLRQRTMLVVPFEETCCLKSFSVYNELFYNLSIGRFTQDRICPCQFTFAVFKEVDLDVFFLVRLFDTDEGWQKSAVLGTQLNF